MSPLQRGLAEGEHYYCHPLYRGVLPKASITIATPLQRGLAEGTIAIPSTEGWQAEPDGVCLAFQLALTFYFLKRDKKFIFQNSQLVLYAQHTPLPPEAPLSRGDTLRVFLILDRPISIFSI